MSRRSAAVVIALALLLSSSTAAAGAAPVVRASVEPATVGVGDPLVVTVDVAVAEGDPGDVRIEIDPGPLTALGAPRLERVEGGVRATQRLACLSLDCVPGERARDVVVPPAGAHVGAVSAAGPTLRVRVVPRVPAAALEPANPPFRRTTTPPPPSYRISPSGLAGMLYGGAAVLGLVALALVALELRRRRSRVPRAAVDPLVRAVRLVRESAARSSSDRRRALGLLARVLAERGRNPLAETAEAAAWSARPPGPGAANALAGQVDSGATSRGDAG
jgi:hypothetical protein